MKRTVRGRAAAARQSPMPYSYYEHVSDIGIRAEGRTLEEAFACGMEAALAVMFDLDTIGDVTAIEARASAPEIDLLFVEAINEVLSLMGRDELALKGIRDVKIERDASGGYAFSATAYGERFDMDKHAARTEVKGATYSGLSYGESDGAHVLTCILDV